MLAAHPQLDARPRLPAELHGCAYQWADTLEMCAAMYVPLVLVPLIWIGLVGPMTFMVVAHVVMMVLMLVIVLRQHGERSA